MNARLRLAGFLVLAVGLLSPVALGRNPPPPPENKVEWDAPPKNGRNPDSPAAGTITGKGTVTPKPNWKCTKVQGDVVEIPSFKIVAQLSGPPTGNAWSFSTNKATSNTTCVVTITGYFEEINNPNVTGNKSTTPQTVSVK
ncbi:MAG: hypothetical protein K2X87_16005 [Gemmataceae bacterium]|nr:hypothetical protein [Gemmataceae bacterium]